MSTVEEQVRNGLSESNIIQLATASDNQPWLCTVHFFADEDLNIYWCSDETRRHSVEISSNNKAAMYVLVHENTPEEDYVIGISIEGSAELVKGSTCREACEGYVKKHGKDRATLEKLVNDEKPFYRFTPKSIVMFNNRDFGDNTRQELDLTNA